LLGQEVRVVAVEPVGDEVAGDVLLTVQHGEPQIPRRAEGPAGGRWAGQDGVMTGRVRNPWGWGFADAVIDGAAARAAAAEARWLLGFGAEEPEQPVPAAAARLAEPRLPLPPGRLAELCTRESTVRAGHAHGRSYLDVVRALRGRYDHLPDVVAFPRYEADVAELLAWAELVGAAVVPYGGGTDIQRTWRFQRRFNRILSGTRDREFQKLRTHLISEMVGRKTAEVKLRPAGLVALEWARLVTEV